MNIICETTRQPLGFIRFLPPLFFQKNRYQPLYTVYLEHIFIDPHKRCQGLGSLLLTETEQFITRYYDVKMIEGTMWDSDDLYLPNFFRKHNYELIESYQTVYDDGKKLTTVTPVQKIV